MDVMPPFPSFVAHFASVVCISSKIHVLQQFLHDVGCLDFRPFPTEVLYLIWNACLMLDNFNATWKSVPLLLRNTFKLICVEPEISTDVPSIYMKPIGIMYIRLIHACVTIKC